MQSNSSSVQHVRKYIRHPSDVPIKVTLNWVEDGSTTHPCDRLNNVGLGGLSFKSPQALPNGQAVNVTFPVFKNSHTLIGTVMWNKKSEGGYEIGVQFTASDELFRLRMIEQICQIEHYRTEVKARENRTLSIEEAAEEWIARFAGDFPSLES